MEIQGTLCNLKFTDLSTGYASFDISLGEDRVPVKGFIPDFPEHTPLSLECDLSQDGSYFKATSFKLFSSDLNRTLLFLQDFPGIGKETSEQIVKETGVDIFSFLRKHGSLQCNTKDAVKNLVAGIKDLLYKEDLYKFLFKNGADSKSVFKLYAKFMGKTFDEIKKNPYIYTLLGGGALSVSEKIADSFGIKEYDARRIHCITLTAMKSVHDKGDTVIDFKSLLHKIRFIEKKNSGKKRSDIFLIGQELCRDDFYYIDDVDGNVYISLLRDKICEKRIAENIKRLFNSSEDINTSGEVTLVSDVEKALGVTYSLDQRDVLQGITKSGVYVITGGPGTGKTTLLKGILFKYHRDNPKGKIVLCSPTGAAARRMSDACGKDSSTIHRLLDIKPFETDILDFKRDAIDASLVVVDETSMLDETIAAVLLSAVKNAATVLFIGDKDQLPSVDAGNVMGDLLDSKCIKCFYLTTIFRQKHGSLIVDNARKVLSGNVNLSLDEDFTIVRKQHDYQVADTVCNIYKKSKEAGVSSLRIFSSVRQKKFICSTTALNCRIKDMDDKEILFSYGAYKYSVGEKIIFVKNNYTKGYYNGQEGVITGATRTTRGCSVYIENSDGEFTLTASELCDIEPAFAITAHKAQGSECDVAVIGITKEPANMNLKKILYVELTRAKRRVIIVTERDALEDAIRSNRDLTRQTGLVREIRKVFESEVAA